MNAITSNSATLASALLSLSSQTRPAGSNGDGNDGLTLPPATDTLNLSGSQAGSTSNDLTTQQIEQQNLISALADPSAALTANQSAISLIASDPTTAAQAQSGLTSQTVMTLA